MFFECVGSIFSTKVSLILTNFNQCSRMSATSSWLIGFFTKTCSNKTDSASAGSKRKIAHVYMWEKCLKKSFSQKLLIGFSTICDGRNFSIAGQEFKCWEYANNVILLKSLGGDGFPNWALNLVKCEQWNATRGWKLLHVPKVQTIRSHKWKISRFLRNEDFHNITFIFFELFSDFARNQIHFFSVFLSLQKN